MKIGYLGPEGSYSHVAAQAFLSEEEAQSRFLKEKLAGIRQASEAIIRTIQT